ncbi:MAG TPA: cytochrome c oxidase assembly protein [Bacillales bacterium]|nr:cytochrome c oxidase assembly protein [Bacillales bacterium]
MQEHPSLHAYSFSAMWHPVLILVLVGIAVLYFLLITRWRSRFAESEPVPRMNQFYMIAGLVLYYAVEGSPWKMIGEYLFTAHMISMTIAYLAVPPLILLGIPRWFWKPVLHKPILLKILKACTTPFIIVVVFNVVFSFDHIPFIFNYIMMNMAMMAAMHYLLLTLGFLMWWPVLTPLPEMRQLSYLMKIAYLFADGMLLTPACALLAFSNHAYFDMFTSAPRIIWFMTPIWDQQAAGVFMKVIQEVTYGIALLFVIYKWATTERKKEMTDDPFAASAMSQSLRAYNPRESEN